MTKIRSVFQLLTHFVVLVAASVPMAASAKKSSDEFDRRNYDLPEAVAIQDRRYQMNQSLEISAGYFPTDSFNKGYAVSGAYKYQFNSYLAWEVVRASYVHNEETALKSDFRETQGSVKAGQGGRMDYPTQVFLTGVHYSPLYSKNLLFNSKLIYGETSFYLGAGAIQFKQSGVEPTVAIGIASRLYLSPSFAFNMHLRDYLYRDTHIGTHGILDLGVGFEFGFGGERTK